MEIWSLSIIDIIVIILYFAVVLWIGFRAMKRIQNEEDYFLGGRRFGKMIQTFAAFGQGTSAESAVTTTTMVSTNGAAGIGLGLLSGIFGMPLLWMTTMWYRRLRYLSLAEFFQERYGSKAMAGYYAVAQAIMFMIVAAGGFTAMSKTVAAITEKPETVLTQQEKSERAMALELQNLQTRDYRLLTESEQSRMDDLLKQKPHLTFSYINRNYLTITLAVIVLLYAVSGGLEAAFVTDMIQGIFIIILTFILIPFGMMKINTMYGTHGFLGTFQAFHQNLPDAFFKVLGSPNVPQFTWYYIVCFGILSLVNVAVQANQLTAAGSAKDDETARCGFITGIFIKRYCGVIWGFIAMMTLLLYSNQVTDPDYVWGKATRDLLCPGLVGLMIACLMAALMSTADALMLTSSSLLTNSVYKPLFPGRSEKHYIFAGRLFCLVYIVGGVAISIALDNVFELFIFMMTFNSMIAASFWLGMIWRRATNKGAWVSIIVTSLFTLILPILAPMVPGVRQSSELMKKTVGYTVRNEYKAKEIDVKLRQKEIDNWQALNAVGKAEGQCPQPLQVGEMFTKLDYIEPQSIFWQKGLIKNSKGEFIGGGMLKVELVVLDWMGFDLTQNKRALNESLTALLRILIPFATVIIVSLITRREDQQRLNFFYGRLRTPVNSDHALDAVEVEKTRNNPVRFDHLKLLPHSNLEFRKWTAADWRGQMWVVMASAGVLLLMVLLVTLGR